MNICIVTGFRFLRDALLSELGSRGVTDTIDVVALNDLLTTTVAPAPRVLFASVGVNEGLGIIGQFCSSHPTTSVCILAMSDHDADFIAWASLGIHGYMEPNTSIQEMAAIIIRIAAGEIVCPPRLSTLLLNQFARRSVLGPRASLNELTRREQQIVALLSDGRSNKHIARDLAITDATVKNHVHSILEKLGSRSRGEAGAAFRRSQAGMPARAASDHAPSFKTAMIHTAAAGMMAIRPLSHSTKRSLG